MRAISITFNCAVIISSNSLTSSPTIRRSPPQSGHAAPGSSSRRSRGVVSETRGRRRGLCSTGSDTAEDGATVSSSSSGASSASATATSRSSSASSSCSISRSIFPSLHRTPVSEASRSATARPAPAGHGPAVSPISWHSPPAKSQSSPSTGRDHLAGLRYQSAWPQTTKPYSKSPYK